MRAASVLLSYLAASLVLAAASEARAQSCGDLWYERNGIYKSAGYCFRTARGIRAFGNAGCQYDDENDVPLSPRQRQRVQQLRALERDLGCPR